MDAPFVNYMLRTFEGNINTGYLKEIKLYLQEIKGIYKESDKLYISISNDKYVIDHFISLVKKYRWGRLAFMVETGAGPNNIFSQVEKINILDIYNKAHGYFGLQGIGNVGNNVLPNPLVVSDL